MDKAPQSTKRKNYYQVERRMRGKEGIFFNSLNEEEVVQVTTVE